LLLKTIILETTTNIIDKGVPYQSTHTRKQKKGNLITKSIIQELNNGTRNPTCKKLKLTYTMGHYKVGDYLESMYTNNMQV
jgi:hypothetical protein